MNSISLRDQIWPATAAWADGELTIAGCGVRALAAEYGTPLYVLDEADFRARCAAWLDAFPDGDVHYGGKAFLAPAVVRWLAESGLCLDVCSGGELAVARVDLAAVLHAAVPADLRIAVEPGRAIAGPSTVAVYEVGTVKDRFVAVDGGMSDNPRPATYGAAYTAVLASRRSDAPAQTVTIVGKHCESGDVLIEDIDLPADLAPGDLIAIPCSGAYQRSAAGNYNLVTRPPVVAVNENGAHVIVRRETEEDLLRLYP